MNNHDTKRHRNCTGAEWTASNFKRRIRARIPHRIRRRPKGWNADEKGDQMIDDIRLNGNIHTGYGPGHITAMTQLWTHIELDVRVLGGAFRGQVVQVVRK